MKLERIQIYLPKKILKHYDKKAIENGFKNANLYIKNEIIKNYNINNFSQNVINSINNINKKKG